MELKEIIRQMHRLIEAKEKRKISQKEMADKLGIPHTTYLAYVQGRNEPTGMKALFEMLNNLDDDDIVEVVRMWKEDDINSGND